MTTNQANVTSAVRNFFLAMYRTQSASHAMDMAACNVDNVAELNEIEKQLTAIKNRTLQAPILNILVNDEPIEWKEVGGEELLSVCGL